MAFLFKPVNCNPPTLFFLLETMANVVKKVFSYDRALRQVENSTGVLQAQTATTLQNIQSQVSHFWQTSETELMPELTGTIDVARNRMEAMANESHQAVQRFSCIPAKDIHVFYLDRQFLSHPCYPTRGRIKITCI